MAFPGKNEVVGVPRSTWLRQADGMRAEGVVTRQALLFGCWSTSDEKLTTRRLTIPTSNPNYLSKGEGIDRKGRWQRLDRDPMTFGKLKV
jgi:hypothetical protein